MEYLQVRFWRFAKKRNSVKQPPEEWDRSMLAVLKDDTNILKPVLQFVNMVDKGWLPANYNYAKIEQFNRYYYIDNWEYKRGIWECSLEVDVLASWRSEILNTSYYVTRSESDKNDRLLDSLYPTEIEPVVLWETADTNPWTFDEEKGTYIVGIINGASEGFGAVSYYAFTPILFRALSKALFETPDWLQIDGEEISHELLKSLFNPFQYIVSVMYFPLSLYNLYPANMTESEIDNAFVVNKIGFGWWSFDVVAYKLDTPVREYYYSIKVPKHPQASLRGGFLKGEPYSKYQLYFPGFGDIVLDAGLLYTQTYLDFTLRIDFITGKAFLFDSTEVTSHFSGQVGIPVQLSQISTNVLGTMSNAVSTVGNVASSLFSLDFGGALKNAASGIVSTINTAIPQLMTSGTNGSLLEVELPPTLKGVFYIVSDDNSNEWGYPCCKRRTLNGLSGFVKVADSHIEIFGYKEESDTIDSALTGGVFIE